MIHVGDWVKLSTFDPHLSGKEGTVINITYVNGIPELVLVDIEGIYEHLFVHREWITRIGPRLDPVRELGDDYFA